MRHHSNAPARLPSAYSGRRGKRPQWLSSTGIVVVIGALLAVAVAALWLQDDGARTGLAGSANDTTADAASLWDWADTELSGGSEQASWSARWDTSLDAEQAERLASSLGLVDSGPSGRIREEPLYRMTLWLENGSAVADPSASGEAVRAVLLLEGSPGLGRADLLSLIDAAEAALEEGGPLQASVNFKGTASDGQAAARIAAKAGAIEAERYEDSGTSSVAYTSDAIGTQPVGPSGVNLQLVSRYDSFIRGWRVAGGVPLVTGDYATAFEQ